MVALINHLLTYLHTYLDGRRPWTKPTDLSCRLLNWMSAN